MSTGGDGWLAALNAHGCRGVSCMQQGGRGVCGAGCAIMAGMPVAGRGRGVGATALQLAPAGDLGCAGIYRAQWSSTLTCRTAGRRGAGEGWEAACRYWSLRHQPMVPFQQLVAGGAGLLAPSSCNAGLACLKQLIAACFPTVATHSNACCCEVRPMCRGAGRRSKQAGGRASSRMSALVRPACACSFSTEI